MLNIISKTVKKSIDSSRHLNLLGMGQSNRIDIFIIIFLLILIISPFIFINRKSVLREAVSNNVILLLSPYSGELFGSSLIESVLLEFEEEYAGIKIRFVNNELNPDEQPDIFFFDEGDYSSLIRAGSLAELNIFTNNENTQFAIPLVSFMNMLFYNIDILSAAGFDHPPKTRAEYTSYARRVSRGDFDASGAALSLSLNDRHALSRDVLSWIWAGGSNIWQDSGRPYLNTRNIINDLTFLGTLYREGVITPDIFNTTGDMRLDQFARGKVAMMITSTRFIPYLRERMGDSAFGITTIPDAGTGGNYNIDISSIYTGINAACEYLEEAWLFLQFITEKSSQFCAELNAVPGTIADIIPGSYVRIDPFYSKAWDIFETASIIQGFSGNIFTDEYKSIFIEELRMFFENNRTALQTVTAIQNRWDEVTPHDNHH